jgi:hypothetical protein
MAMPDRLLMAVDADVFLCRQIALTATKRAREDSPKLSGASSRRINPIHAEGLVGLQWVDPYVWYQNQGIRAFTMRGLAGKTIPMWIDDPTGKERQKNPKARTRTTESGKTQVLIFRRAAEIGARRRVRRGGTWTDVPASYPGAPGRIAVREAAQPDTTPGKVAGAIARGNVGVRWRHPGLGERHFLQHALETSVMDHGVIGGPIIAADAYGKIAA